MIPLLLGWPVCLALVGIIFSCSNNSRNVVRGKSKKSMRDKRMDVTDSKTTETACSTEAKVIHQKESTGVAKLFAEETTVAACAGKKSSKDQRSRKSLRPTKQKSASERTVKTANSAKSKRSARSDRGLSKETMKTSDAESQTASPMPTTSMTDDQLESRKAPVSDRKSKRKQARKRSSRSFRSLKKSRSTRNLETEMAEAPKQLQSQEELDAFTAGPELSLVHFFADWAPQCTQLNTVLEDLAGELKNSFSASFIDAEGVAEASSKNKIKAVPTVVFYRNGREVDRLDGFKPAELRTHIVKHTSGRASAPKSEVETSGQSLNDRLKALINAHSLMLFMKGDPSAPKCGFSRTIVGMLNEHNIAFGSFDILSDDQVRQGLKEYSNWPTYPQLYLNGELLGGLDVVREEFKDADFIASLPKKV